jgi:hypothetical protein
MALGTLSRAIDMLLPVVESLERSSDVLSWRSLSADY